MEQLNKILEVSDIEEKYHKHLGNFYIFSSKEMTPEGRLKLFHHSGTKAETLAIRHQQYKKLIKNEKSS